MPEPQSLHVVSEHAEGAEAGEAGHPAVGAAARERGARPAGVAHAVVRGEEGGVALVHAHAVALALAHDVVVLAQGGEEEVKEGEGRRGKRDDSGYHNERCGPRAGRVDPEDNGKGVGRPAGELRGRGQR